MSEPVTLVRADNPNPMTLEGTNTYLLAGPDSEQVLVVDPGPLLPAHLGAIAAAAGPRRVTGIVLTHGHGDHSAAAPELARRTGAWVRAVDPGHRLGDEGLPDGSVLAAAGVELTVVATPGHSADSVCLLLAAERLILTGDTVLGRGTTVVAHPDGRLADYLDSLQRLADLADGLQALLPGHGPRVTDPVGVLRAYLAHRASRLDQVRAALADGLRTPGEVVARVYADVDRVLWPAADLSVRAQLEYLGHDPGPPSQMDPAAVAALQGLPTP